MIALGRYAKAITALLVGGATWLGTAWVPDGQIDRTEWYGLVLVTLGALGVYGVPNAKAKDQTADLIDEHVLSAANTPPADEPLAPADIPSSAASTLTTPGS